MLNCAELSTAIFVLLAAHYVFNLSYNTEAADFFVFLQEKIAGIPSRSEHKSRKDKSTVAVIHTNGITRVYDNLKEGNCSDDD